MHGLLWNLSLQTWHSSWFCITLSSDFSRFKIECLLEKEPAQFFLRSRPKLHIRFINLLYLPCRKFVQSQNMHQNPSAMFLVASRVHLILYLHYLLYYIAILWVFTIKIPFLSTNHMVYFIEISDFVFPWTTWNTRGLSSAVWITHWISLFLLTERNSTERQLRHKTEMTHLWQFLLQRLKNDSFSSIISWSRKDHSEFKVRSPKKLALRWGIFKRNKAVTYKKLSRALKYSYQLGNIKTVSQYISLHLHGR